MCTKFLLQKEESIIIGQFIKRLVRTKYKENERKNMQNKPEEMAWESQNTQGLADFVEKFVFILRAIGSQRLSKREKRA